MKRIEVNADAANTDTVASIAEQHASADFRLGYNGEDGRQVMRILITDDRTQAVLDGLQQSLGKDSNARIMVLGVEVALPRLPEKERTKEEAATTTTQKALYENIEKIPVWMAIFRRLVWVLHSVTWRSCGKPQGLTVSVWALLIAFGIGSIWPVGIESHELMSRTDGLNSVARALASGAAAVLSITTSLSSVLVGVMVAAALLPPTATLGMLVPANMTTRRVPDYCLR